MNTSGIRGFFVGVIIVTSSLSVLAMTIPKIFVANQPIKASDVNLNFSAVKTAVDTLELKALRFGTVATGVNAVASLSLINTGTGNGLVSTASGTAFGIAGVAGYNLGTTNFTVGVYGVAKASPSGTGVKGIGGVVGGYFEAVGDGVPGLAPTGVLAVSTKGTGLQGKGLTGVVGTGSVAGVTGSGLTGVKGTGLFGVEGTGGTGVKGTGTGPGVYGVSSSGQLRVPGVLGVNENATGQVVGVLGQATNSPIGTGVNGIGKIAGGYFEATSGPAGGYTPAGVTGVANAGKGVEGTGLVGVAGKASAANAVAMSATGNVTQDNQSYGWAKALLLVDAKGRIDFEFFMPTPV
jgi:hypothetical protein